MAAHRHTDEALRETLRLVEQHGTVAAAARAVGMPVETLRSRVHAARMRGLTSPLVPTPTPTAPAVASAAVDAEPLAASFEDAWHRWQQCIGMRRERYAGPAPPRETAGRARILVLPDLHVPYHEREMLADLIARESGHVDRVIGIGDIGDSYALSRYEKYEWMPYRDEWAEVTLVIQTLSEAFPAVELVIGNHDQRLDKQLRQRLTPDMVEALLLINDGRSLCPISAIARRYPNVSIARHVTPDGRTVDWFTSMGDAWLGHPEKFSRVPGSALRGVEEWLLDKEHELGLARYRLICLGHTHAYGMFPWRAGSLLVEVGCLCQTQGYMLSPRIGGRPQRRGYLTFEQEHGRTDLNSVRFHWYDEDDRFRAAGRQVA